MFSLIVSMFTFSLSMSISPGPVNLTILSNSMNYGVKRTFAFISGATVGFATLLAAVCLGLYQILMLYPVLLNLITVFGTALLVWIGWSIMRARGEEIQVQSKDVVSMPGFMQGVFMQWLNPKAWIAAVAGTALFSAASYSLALPLFIAVYFVVCYLSLLVWGIAGEKLADFLNKGNRARIFNILMGWVLIIISLEMCLKHFLK